MKYAEQEIRTAQTRIGRLRQSVRIFRKKIETNEPWPGTTSTRN